MGHKLNRLWKGRRWLALGAMLTVLAVLPGIALAQGGLTYGSTVAGSLTAETPFTIYAFQANAGDQISVTVMGVSPGMQPGVSLLGPDQRQLAVSGADPFGAEDGRTARISHRAATTGLYSLLVSNVAGGAGDFVLALSGRPSESSSALEPDVPVTINIPPGAPPILYSFNAPQSGTFTLSLSTSSPNFAFLTRVYNPDGSLVAGLAGKALTAASLSVGPGTGFYEVSIAGLDPETQGAVQIVLSTGGPGALPAIPPSGDQGIITATPGTPLLPVSTPTVCQASSSVNVNVRGGPGTNYPVFGALQVGSTLNVVGRNSVSSWFVVDYNGRQGWVASSVVILAGPCGSLPFIADPPTPTFTPTLPVTLTPTPALTATPTPTATPMATFSGTLIALTPIQIVTLAPVATLNYSLPANYGSTALTSGFVPDPHTVGITSGGPVDVSYLGSGCSGFATSAPDFSVNYTSGAFPTLRFYFIGSGDTTMVINSPSGSYNCVDDSFGTLNPTIDFNSPSSGRYDVWIGSYASGAFVSGTLYVTENTGNHP